jgi:hypothetical protein
LEHIDKIENRFGEIEKLAGDRRLHLTRGNLAEILNRCLAQFQNDFAAHNVYYSLSGLNALPLILMDAEKMDKVIKFLVTSARHRLPEGGTLTIHAYSYSYLSNRLGLFANFARGLSETVPDYSFSSGISTAL